MYLYSSSSLPVLSRQYQVSSSAYNVRPIKVTYNCFKNGSKTFTCVSMEMHPFVIRIEIKNKFNPSKY